MKNEKLLSKLKFKKLRNRLRLGKVIEKNVPDKETVVDSIRLSLEALKELADGFPPLKSVVEGVIAIWDIQRVRVRGNLHLTNLPIPRVESEEEQRGGE